PRIVRAAYRSGAGVYLGAAPPAPARFRAPGVKFARGGGRTRLPGKLAPEEGKHVMSVQDLELNCQVRAIVAKFWIDPNRLSLSARRGNVHISGELRFTGAEQDHEQTVEMLQSLESDLRSLHDIRELEFELTNWTHDASGGWVCVEKRPAAEQPLSAPSV